MIAPHHRGPSPRPPPRKQRGPADGVRCSMPPPPPPKPDHLARTRLISAASALLAAGGLGAISEHAVAAQAQLPADAVRTCFGDTDALLAATTFALASFDIFSEPEPRYVSRSVAKVLDALAVSHRRYVDDDPNRYAALLQLAAASVFVGHELLDPLAERHRRSRATVEHHLRALDGQGLLAAGHDLAAVAGVFVDAATGIEMCHVLDRDEELRRLGYAALQLSLLERLTHPPAHLRHRD